MKEFTFMTVTNIDTRFGTYNSADFSNGNTLPYTGLPFGRHYFVPQTLNTDGSWFFSPLEPLFYGFRLTHQPSPWMGDFSHFNMIPFAGEIKGYSLYGLKTSYLPDTAVYQPHYLSLTLNRYRIKAELTPNEYGAKIKCHYQMAENAGISFPCPGRSNFTYDQENHLLSGSIINYSGCEDPDFTMYVAIRCHFNSSEQKQPRVSFAVHGDPSNGANYILHFENFKENQTVDFSVAASFLSQEQAIANLITEESHTFEETKEAAAKKWNERLDKISIEHHDQTQVAIFNHCLYHCFLFPQKMYELDKEDQPVHYDTHNQKIRPGVYYTNNGFWDTSKTSFPLFALIARKDYREMLEGFLNYYHEVGYLPKWLSPDERGLMPGTLIDAVIAEAAQTQIAPDLLPQLLDAMVATAENSTDKIYGREAGEIYKQLGYLPANIHESVNKSLDYCYSDYCISQTADLLNQKQLAQKYGQRSKNYQNLFDPKTLFLAPKDKQGNFTDFDAEKWGGCYTEGSAWQNAFNIYHDVNGLQALHPNDQSFLQQLKHLCNQEPLFKIGGYPTEIHEMSEAANAQFGQIAISNQPSFHLPYLFHFTQEPYWTDVIIKQALTNLFSNDFFAYPGDEDNGSLSAWYIFNSLGFYPFCPGSGKYLTGIPLFDRVVVKLDTGKELVIETNNNRATHQFVTHLSYNGCQNTTRSLPVREILQGGKLSYTLGIVAPPTL